LKKITIFYEKGYYGRLRAVKIYVDNIEIGQLKQGQELTCELPDAANIIYAKIDWGKTDPLNVDSVYDGEQINLKSYFTLNPLRNIGIMPLPFIWKK